MLGNCPTSIFGVYAVFCSLPTPNPPKDPQIPPFSWPQLDHGTKDSPSEWE